MKFKKNEDQNVDTLSPLRIENKAPMEGVTETKFGAEMKTPTLIVIVLCTYTFSRYMIIKYSKHLIFKG